MPWRSQGLAGACFTRAMPIGQELSAPQFRTLVSTLSSVLTFCFVFVCLFSTLVVYCSARLWTLKRQVDLSSGVSHVKSFSRVAYWMVVSIRHSLKWSVLLSKNLFLIVEERCSEDQFCHSHIPYTTDWNLLEEIFSVNAMRDTIRVIPHTTVLQCAPSVGMTIFLFYWLWVMPHFHIFLEIMTHCSCSNTHTVTRATFVVQE